MYLPFILVYTFLVATRRSLMELAYFGIILIGLIIILKPKRSIFKHLGFLLGFEGLLFVLALFNPGQPILNTPFGVVTREGVYSFVLLFSRAFLASSAVVVVSNSIGFPRILAEMEALKFPRILVLTLAFTYRYLDLFKDEALRMKRALDSRTFGIGKREYYKKLGALISEIFVRAYLRNEKIYMAMLSRGFGEFPKLEEEISLTPFALALVTLLGVLI
ncbi:cobalt ABC transporter permease CbiQ [Palaeococcus pacificus DY20341]|uniref:Cobalt ABC transporter permease CbiQ n=1 Tax=Palaeococcus pacificus DY20341 TaxID=1343739 RepID=A0A075LS52_9EURY|nr:CbiQ family ECF transporter T component [Palaeococcus pacificus]AIF68777.1 cobalt ABC transporter permease CbiQ [Palaeococcus pacificus DY20341]